MLGPSDLLFGLQGRGLLQRVGGGGVDVLLEPGLRLCEGCCPRLEVFLCEGLEDVGSMRQLDLYVGGGSRGLIASFMGGGGGSEADREF
jgi:hypothetical protein